MSSLAEVDERRDMIEQTQAFAPRRGSADSTEIESESEVQTVLDALNDPGCRAILRATDDEALSANEISETCELPLSTTYRKVDMLLDGGLIEERTRIRRGGKHPSEYVRLVTSVVVSVSEAGGPALRVSKRRQPVDGALPSMAPERGR